MQPTHPIDAAAAVVELVDETATDRLGRALAACLRPGDTVLLSGPVGAGKSHLARAFLHARFGAATEVPSPTFTLVQTYGSTPGDEVWHADLYRLSGIGDLEELGLEAALGTAICLIEWPERLGARVPPDALRLELSVSGDGRRAFLSGGRPGLIPAVSRALSDG